MANVIGFDDAPFPHGHRGNVDLVGVVCAGTRLDGVVVGQVRRDGTNSTRVMGHLVRRSRFYEHVQAVLLQGITVAGFNVVDVHALHADLGIPVLAIARKRPDFSRIRKVLFERVPGGAKKWALLERAGPMEELEGLLVQRVGIDTKRARALLRSTRLHGNLPEPLRLAHLIAGAYGRGESKGGA
jgi:endonuclease V-like protein UPF0215 family